MGIEIHRGFCLEEENRRGKENRTIFFPCYRGKEKKAIEEKDTKRVQEYIHLRSHLLGS